VAEFGSGSGRKTAGLLRALPQRPTYHPIDVSTAALVACTRELAEITTVVPEAADYDAGLTRVLAQRASHERLLLLFLGSTIGNFPPAEALAFLRSTRGRLRPGDALLLGADLVKDVATLITAYDDPTGVTAAFNRNVLGRINRELGADFDLANFAHEARYERDAQRIEMHLRARSAARIAIPGAGLTIELAPGETLWTESSHKFTERGIDRLVAEAGWLSAQRWIDPVWAFAETLLLVP
ncbi:MAG: L-histidine N(alpha)-methyltransferase, partial [Burkholderiaceae bacterium]